MSLDAVINHIADIFETKVILTHPDFKEVGFDVFWGSRGHVIVQDDKQTMPYETLIKDHPQFNKQYDDRPVMIEFAWGRDAANNVQYRYWLSLQLSEENGAIDPAQYHHYLNQ